MTMRSLLRIRNYFRGPASSAGFTLVEALVAALVFSIIAMAVSTFFTRSLGLQRKGLGAQKVQENALFALELMAREIRVSTFPSVQDAPACDNTSLTIIHPVNGTVTYAFDASNEVITRTAGGVTANLTASDINVTRLGFCVKGSGLDGYQARVGIVANFQSDVASAQDRVDVDIQTSVSLRDVVTELTP